MAAVPKKEIDMEAAVGRDLPLIEGAPSVSTGLSTDPDLHGGTGCLLFRLLRFVSMFRLTHLVSFVSDVDRAQIKKWEFPEEERDSCLARLVGIDNEIDVLRSAKSISVGSQLFENLETELMRKHVERLTWKIDLLKGVVFQTISNTDDLRKAWLKRGEEIRDCKVVIEALKEEGEIDKTEQRKLADLLNTEQCRRRVLSYGIEGEKVRIDSLQHELAEKSKALKAVETSLTSSRESAQELELKLKESYSEMALKLKEGAEMAQKVGEMARKLREKDVLLETTRKKSEADRLQLEEKLSIEKSSAQQTEELNVFLKEAFESLHSVCQNTKSKYRQREKKLSDTRRRSEGSQRKTKCGQNDGSDNLDIEVDHETGLQNGRDTIQTKTPSMQGGRKKRKVKEN